MSNDDREIEQAVKEIVVIKEKMVHKKDEPSNQVKEIDKQLDQIRNMPIKEVKEEEDKDFEVRV